MLKTFDGRSWHSNRPPSVEVCMRTRLPLNRAASTIMRAVFVPSKTIEPKPIKIGLSPSFSHATNGAYSGELSSTRFACWSQKKKPVTRDSGGQSAGRGESDGDHICPNGTC